MFDEVKDDYLSEKQKVSMIIGFSQCRTRGHGPLHPLSLQDIARNLSV